MVLLAQLTDGYKIVQIKILVTRGKEQEAGHGLTHGAALCCRCCVNGKG